MRTRSSAGENHDHLAAIEEALGEVLGGFEVHERELSIDGRPVADLLGSCERRAFLVRMVDGTTDAAALAALDALAFAHGQPEVLAASLGLDPGELQTPRVVLVAAAGFSAAQLDRLELLRGDELWLLRRRELRSKSGTRTRLELLDVGDGRTPGRAPELPTWAVREPLRGFLASIAPDRVVLALELLERLGRVDPDLRWTAPGADLVAEIDECELCRLVWTDGHLELRRRGQLEAEPVRDAEAVERVLEGVLVDYLALVGQPLVPRAATPVPQPVPSPGCPAPPAVERPSAPVPVAREVEESEEVESEAEEGLPQVDLYPRASGPILTDEEIQAFHDAIQGD